MPDLPHALPLSPQQFHILLALSDRERHGYGIILDVLERTNGALRLGTGTLYTAVARLLALGWIVEADHQDRRRRVYRLTPDGRTVLQAETARLEALVAHAHAARIFGARRPAHGRPRS